MERKSFLDQEAPAGYVAGSARGAVGFRLSLNPDSFNRGVAVVTKEEEEDEEAGEGNGNGNVDGTNDKGILSRSKRDEEDEEADRIYEEIEKKLASKKATPKTSPPQSQTATTNKPQFSDLKRQLANLTEDDWLNLPEPGDMTRRNKRMRLLEQQQQRMYSAPDTLIAAASSSANGSTNFKSLSESRDKFLSSQLDNLLPKSANVTSTDARLQESILSMDGAEQDLKYADFQKSRSILSSLRKTEPYKPSSWIQSARLEEQNKNYKLAKSYILEGCKKCPKSDEIWLENIRLNRSDLKLCKQLVNTALGYVPKSENLWVKAMDLEAETFNKRKVVMKSLENLPGSSKLWKLLIDLETDQDTVKKLLGKAVEMCPLVWEFWLGLINLSNYEESKKLLNQARKKLTGDPNVWIAACKLEEREQDVELSKLVKLMDKAIKEASSRGISKDEWYQMAIEAEKEEFRNTSRAIVSSYLNAHKERANDSSLLEDVDKLVTNGNVIVGRAILDHIIESHSHDVSHWRKLITSMKKFTDLEVLFSYYNKAIELNPSTALFYLMFAKDKWQLANDIPEARAILNRAAAAMPKDISIKFAIIKLELRSGHIDSARDYIKEIIDTSPMESEKFWYKYIHILRCLKSTEALETCQKALRLFPESWKLYLQNIQILQDMNKPEQAREIASISVKKCKGAPQLWIKLSEIDEQLGILIRARAVIDQAMVTNPESPDLWSYKIQFEKQNQDLVAARNISNKSLKKFPHNADLWIEYLWLLPKMSQRKTAFLDALKATDNSSLILLVIGVFFWYDGKYNKCKNWFERSLLLDNTNGDTWAWLFNYLKKFGTKEELERFVTEYEANYDAINKGKVFNVVNKDIANYDKSPKEILEITAGRLSKTITT
ncbi:Pre-mRNA-splicing factor 6 [Candida viswanathii]|uniref:Pre-mRNA-splicing factor 6 n=1 Tax=Candida viswanathii TaxID=5486 RepID=A0A367YEN3_9ASCO|nr:Pre-mRNA-splicing factor 6 [Candida viswanathii]